MGDPWGRRMAILPALDVPRKCILSTALVWVLLLFAMVIGHGSKSSPMPQFESLTSLDPMALHGLLGTV